MQANVKCPECGHLCTVNVQNFSPKVVCCEDPQEGGCGEYFVAEAMDVLVEGYKIEGRRCK